MPIALLLPVILRLAGPIAFVTAAVTAGALNRSFMLVPVLAAGATLTTLLIRKVAPSPVSDLQSLLNPDAPPQQPSIFRGMGRRFGIGLIGYAVAFGISALIAALFQTTEFETRLMPSDAGYVVIPALVALLGAWGSARLGMSQMAGMMGQMQDMFAQMQAAQDQEGAEEPFTVDGEVIDPDEDRPGS